MLLAEKHCTACTGEEEPLTIEQAAPLLETIAGWEMLEDASLLLREFTFRNFKEAFQFVTQVSELAEAEKHHPDIAFGWGYCSIALQTHKIEGLHENDFILAAKINTLV